jgi:small subunit ribosomal protein S17
MKRNKKHNDIGLDVKNPENVCNSEKCPWHGHLKIRGRILKGKVICSKGLNTAIVEWNYYHYIPKYERYERRKTRISVHNPECISAKTGDIVRIGECRPISKTKRFVIFEKLEMKKVKS